MTRKCALCKETNYKNNYSFFSAPKDPETRKKWQAALAIENYAVTDDTYVCSRHFHKNDIITHWVSGVPPQVIKIKYKKCRLRQGAVPGRNLYSNGGSQLADKDASHKCDMDINDFLTFKKRQQESDLLSDENFLIGPRKYINSSDNEYMNKKNNANVRCQTYSKQQDCTYNSKENYESDIVRLSENASKGDANFSACSSESKEAKSKKKELDKTFEDDSDRSLSDVYVEPKIKSADADREENHMSEELLRTDMSNKMVKSESKEYVSSEEDGPSMEIWDHDVPSADSEEPVDDNLKTIDDLYIDNQVLAALDYDNLSTENKATCNDSEHEMLFEDFLEICTEVSVPRGWSCLVTSKGHGTTVVYLCMDITKTGLPFVEKQVFIRSDMMLRCAVTNREIDPVLHNLVKENKHIKLRSLLDIEELIDEFDRRVICQGICDAKNCADVDMKKHAYKDEIKWRHTSCPLILDNDLSRCAKCAMLSRTLLQSSKLLPFHLQLRPSNRTREKEAKSTYISANLKRIGEHDRHKNVKALRK